MNNKSPIEILENTKFLCAHTPFTPNNLVSVTPALSSFDYYDVHKFRFAEMINFISFLQQKLGNNLNILEVGSYLTTKFIKDLCPQTRISILDIAEIKTLEFEPIFKTQDIIDKHYIFDLTRDDLFETDLEGTPQFDVILLCEVIEHLLANPKNLIKFLLKFLKKEGYIYITTPNIFQKSYVEAFQQKINPLPIFPAHYSRSEAKHHHVREYSMSELLEIAEEAGAEIFAFYFSPCWDTPPQREAKDLISPLQHDLANIVIVLKRNN
jgi:predicted SAM-dependent methyltransferase